MTKEGWIIAHVDSVFVVIDRRGEQISPMFYRRAHAVAWIDSWRLGSHENGFIHPVSQLSIGDTDHSDRYMHQRVRRLCDVGSVTDADIGRVFGVSGSTFNRVKRGEIPPSIGLGGLVGLTGVSVEYLTDGLVADAADLDVANSRFGQSKTVHAIVMEAIHGC